MLTHTPTQINKLPYGFYMFLIYQQNFTDSPLYNWTSHRVDWASGELLIRSPPPGMGSAAGTRGPLSGLRHRVLGLWDETENTSEPPRTARVPGRSKKAEPTEGHAPVLPQQVVRDGHYRSFVGHRADDLHDAAQLFFKLGEENTHHIRPLWIC